MIATLSILFHLHEISILMLGIGCFSIMAASRCISFVFLLTVIYACLEIILRHMRFYFL